MQYRRRAMKRTAGALVVLLVVVAIAIVVGAVMFLNSIAGQ